MKMYLEQITDICREYVEWAKKLREAADEYENVDRKFASWSGPTRRAIQASIKSKKSAFDGLIETVMSYPKTAQSAVASTNDLESQLVRMLQ